MSSEKLPRPGSVHTPAEADEPAIEYVLDEEAQPGDLLAPLASLLIDLAESDRARVLPLRPPRDEEADADQGEAKAG
jgi:hypothetical protein